jgi:hypothetical protein
MMTSTSPKWMTDSYLCPKPARPYILDAHFPGVRKRSIVRRSRHAVGYDLKAVTGIARVVAYVAGGFPCATNMRDGKMPCGPSIDVMSREQQVMLQRWLRGLVSRHWVQIL